MKTKTIITSLVAIACLLQFVSFVNKPKQTVVAKASCQYIDTEYNYYLECVGDQGSCKFISPSGSEVLCTGNKAIAYPIPHDPNL